MKRVLLLLVIGMLLATGCIQSEETKSYSGISIPGGKLVYEKPISGGFEEKWVFPGNKITQVYNAVKARYTGWEIIYDFKNETNFELTFSQRDVAINAKAHFDGENTYLVISQST